MKKWNYAVVRNIFGDYWIGKTRNKPIKDKIFPDIDDAVQKALMLFEDSHPEFDYRLDEGEEGYDLELCNQYEEIQETKFDDVEEITKELEKFLV